MIKVVTCIRRRPGMGVEDFQAYWRTRHPAVVTALPGLRRYVQSHTLVAGYAKGQPVWDGIAEVWFDDTAAVRALQPTPEYAAVRADEARFIDRASMVT
ncbi:MAG TPA: EthD domain-containing protein, partial [Vicinamibacteria bacterium]|nr:EthD domain-containing protein [Vicinamibacteria bacterium]